MHHAWNEGTNTYGNRGTNTSGDKGSNTGRAATLHLISIHVICDDRTVIAFDGCTMIVFYWLELDGNLNCLHVWDFKFSLGQKSIWTNIGWVLLWGATNRATTCVSACKCICPMLGLSRKMKGMCKTQN
jgi:hypothetical protein